MLVERLYLKEVEIARLLGHDVGWLRSNRDALERQYNLPKIDPAVGLRHREAVEEWARERNLRNARARSKEPASTENIDAF